MSYALQIKRVYEPAAPEDGWRVLIDRLWPRGISKERAAADWEKGLAPSTELRTWFGHDPARFEAFSVAYRKELDQNETAADFARRCAAALAERNVTLLYAAKDENCCNAPVLRDWLRERLNSAATG